MNHIESGDQFPFLQGLIHGGKLLEARIDARLAAFGLSSAKWNALRHLAVNAGGLPLSELAVHLACVKSNVTQLVDRLAADGLVQRVPDPVDRRSVRAELTATGRARYADGLRVIQVLEQQLQSAYTAHERRLVGRVLAYLESEEAAAT